MPVAAKSPCIGSPTCPHPGTYKGRCAEHSRVQERTRYNAETRKWYSTEAWKTLRAIVLGAQPVCVECHIAPSTKVDHKVPHRGEYAMFFNVNNLQGMCSTCHGRKTARGE
jgi:5-methylcytosine-specific restriction enzyme A